MVFRLVFRNSLLGAMNQKKPVTEAPAHTELSARAHRALRIAALLVTGIGILFLGLLPFLLGSLTQWSISRRLNELVVLLISSTCFWALSQFPEWHYVDYGGRPSALLSYVFFAVFFSGGAASVRRWRASSIRSVPAC